MSSSKSYTQYFAVVLLLSLYSTHQVSATRCYQCDSEYDIDCIYNPAQSKFAVQCPIYASSKNGLLMPEINTAASEISTDDIATKAIIDSNCASAIGISTKDGRLVVKRGCAMKPITCDTYKYQYAVGDLKGNGFQVDRCLRCNTDFCNYAN